MTALPAATDFTGSAVTEGQFKTAITNQRSYLAGLLGTDGAIGTAMTTLGVPLNDTVAKTGAYTLVAGDRGKLLLCSGTWTLTLLAAATAGDGYAFAVRNTGSGTITLDGNLSETIDGATTLALTVGESCLVVCDGTNWHTVGRSMIDADDHHAVQQSGSYEISPTETTVISRAITLASASDLLIVGGGNVDITADDYRTNTTTLKLYIDSTLLATLSRTITNNSGTSITTLTSLFGVGRAASVSAGAHTLYLKALRNATTYNASVLTNATLAGIWMN
jgi:hypothetical protein